MRILFATAAAFWLTGGVALAHADKADDYYSELVEWAFVPCMAVGSAADLNAVDQEARDLGVKREHIAELMLASRETGIRELADKFASGTGNPDWAQRRGIYLSVLRLCLEPFLDQ